MKRRDFLAAASAAGVASLSRLEGLEAQQQGAREFYELRRYHLLYGPKQRVVGDYLRDAAIPAMNRLGIGAVGVFNVVYGTSEPSLYVLIPHRSLDSVVTLRQRLMDDAEHRKAGAAFLDAPMSDPAFVRVESTLMRAFEQMPTLEVPAAAAAKKPRIFELRTYESHSDRAALNKLEMFNQGGEIPIFRRTGLTPVFFGEHVVGEKLPALTYMLTFENMQARDAGWAAFGADPDWRKLSADTRYRENVSTISDVILRPAAYSQI